MSAASAFSIISIVLLDGAAAVFILLAAMGLGALVMQAIRLNAAPPRWRIVMAAGLGTGLLSLSVLGAGLVGLLTRGFWIVVVGGLAAGGLVWLAALSGVRIGAGARRSSASAAADVEPTADRTRSRVILWLWLLAAPFFLLALCAATCPPGYLWPSEGNGYDVLEYHFGAPKEWFVAGRIEYLPHNIYSNFPFNAEMLYLLSFILAGSPVAGVYVAQLVNVLLAVLAVAGAWLAGREFGRLPGIVGGLALATCPFFTWLCGMAYVENGMVAMAALSLACLVRAVCAPTESAVRWAVSSGLLAGFACGFKYTAIPTVALPMLVVWLIAGRSRVQAAAAFALAAAATFAPWAVRNVVNTGNPVFPLARSVFHERPGVWSDEAAARWAEGHRPDPSERSWSAIRRAASERTLLNPLYGPMLFLLPPIGFTLLHLRRSLPARTSRLALASLVFASLVYLVWTRTHLVDRFAIALVIPLAMLCAVAILIANGPKTGLGLVALTAGCAIWNLHTLYTLLRDARVFDLAAFGQTEWMTSGQWPGYAHVPKLNEIAAAGGRVMMLGDARTFYLDDRPGYGVVFNRNPFAEAIAAWRADSAAAMPPANWLRWQGYTHLYVDWGEIARLSRSRYGFWPSIADLRPEDYERMGLTPVEPFQFDHRMYATLFRVNEKATSPPTGPATASEATTAPSR